MLPQQCGWEGWGTSPNLRGRGVAPFAISSLWCPGSVFWSPPDRVPHPPAQAWHCATTRDRALLTWGTCRVLPPFRRAREGAAVTLRLWLGSPSHGAAEAPCSQWGLRRWAGWRLSPSRGLELGGLERAGRCPAQGLRGRSQGRRRWSRLSTAGGPLLTGATEEPLAPHLLLRIPHRQHDRRATTGLLLHRAEG